MRSSLKTKQHVVHYRYELHREGRNEIGEVSVDGNENFSRSLDFNKLGRQSNTDLSKMGIQGFLIKILCAYRILYVLSLCSFITYIFRWILSVWYPFVASQRSYRCGDASGRQVQQLVQGHFLSREAESKLSRAMRSLLYYLPPYFLRPASRIAWWNFRISN